MPVLRTLRCLLAGLTGLAVLAGCGAGSTPGPGPGPGATAALRGTDVTTGLTTPWELVPLPDGSLLTCERDTGRILRIVDGRPSELRRIAESVPGSEGGLLGLAVSPDRGRVFAYYSTADDNRVVVMDFRDGTLGEPRLIFSGIAKGGRHNGGRMVVGPDGHLYVGTGDAGDTATAADRSSLNGKILRLTLDGQAAPGNPFGTEVWSYGHRNAQGLAFDDDGRLWASEFGEQTWDELNLITRGGDYGWPQVEGSSDAPGTVNPKVVWPTSDASPSGLAYWRGSLWMGALRGTRLWQIPVAGTDVGEPVPHFEDTYGRLRAVAVERGGGALLVTTSNTDGRGRAAAGDDRILRVS